jgi:hypothetical protein
MTPLAATLRERRDARFALLTVLVLAVTLDFAMAIYKLWGALLASRYAPAPLVILIAMTVGLPYFWAKTAAERATLRRHAEAGIIEPEVAALALRALYRGLFFSSMAALLLLTALHQLVTP